MSSNASVATDNFSCFKRRAAEYDLDAVTQEDESYMSDKSKDILLLQAHANIRKLFVKYKTGLPTSALVGKLFSLVGKVFNLFEI